jgi:hypothetical protein
LSAESERRNPTLAPQSLVDVPMLAVEFCLFLQS